MSITEIQDGWAVLFEQGGIILWLIFALSILMWTLILERYVFLKNGLPKLREELLTSWKQARSAQMHNLNHNGNNKRAKSTGAQFLADLSTRRFRERASRFILPIETLTVILPMLGLLGTVSGMISVFDVITNFGGGNTRGMAAGISRALVTTMGGLLTAVSGLFFATNIKQRIDLEAHRFTKELELD